MQILDANRWALPRVRYTNFRKHFGAVADGAFKQWFNFQRLWGGRIWIFGIRHHQISLDFRRCWLSDMAYPETTKADRKAVTEARDIANPKLNGGGPAEKGSHG